MSSTAAVVPSAWPRSTTISVRDPSASSTVVWRAAHGSNPAPAAPWRREPPASAAGRSGPPLRPRNSVRSAVQLVCRPLEIEEGDPAGEVGVPRVPGQQRLCFRLVLGDDVRCVGATRRAEHPLGVRRDGQAPRSTGSVLDREHRDLQRLVEWDELHEVEKDAVSHVLEAAVSGTVVGDVGRSLTPDRLRRRAPEVAGVVVADVEGFACWVADGVVGPRRQLVFPAVLGPGVPTAGLGHLEPERLVGDHVEPRSWGRLTGAEDRHVLTPIITEAAEPIEELQLRRRCDGAVPHGLAGDRR